MDIFRWDVDLHKLFNIKRRFGAVLTPYTAHFVNRTKESSHHLIKEMTKFI